MGEQLQEDVFTGLTTRRREALIDDLIGTKDQLAGDGNRRFQIDRRPDIAGGGGLDSRRRGLSLWFTGTIRETLRAALCLPAYLTAMKTALVLVLALAASVPTQAQIFRSPVFGGAVLGAIIGHNSGSLGHSAGRGAAYGAAAGLLLDGAFGPAYRGGYGYDGGFDRRYGRSAARIYVYRDAPFIYGDYGYDYNYDYAFDARPDYPASGLWLGALAGAIIGRNSGSLGHSAWRGAAYGAGAGYLLGSIAEGSYRRREILMAPPTAVASVASAQPQQVTIINNYYNGAGPMRFGQQFVWTVIMPRPGLPADSPDPVFHYYFHTMKTSLRFSVRSRPDRGCPPARRGLRLARRAKSLGRPGGPDETR